MILLDTDALTLLFRGHARVEERLRSAEDDVAITIITRIEILQGRFESILKAADGIQLQRAYERLQDSEQQLATLAVIPIDASAAQHFEMLLRNRNLKRIGRGDLLIASIVLANKATLVSRNLRDFQQVQGLDVQNWAD